jgi:hypothetical protein
MPRWIILPYDQSPLAQAVLRRAARMCREAPDVAPYAGVMLATTGIDPADVGRVVREAADVAGLDMPLEVRLLDAGDPIGSLQRLAATQPDAAFVAPLCPHGITGRAPWYAAACRQDGVDHTLVLFHITDKEIDEVQEASHGGHRVGGPVARLLRAGAGLHLGKRTAVARKSA